MADKALPELDKLLLARALKDAKSKSAALKNRLRDEFEQAEAESREPFPLTPLTSLRADLVLWVCEAAAAKATGKLATVIGIQRKACGTLGDTEVFLLAEDVLPLLEAAGVKGEDDAQV